MKIEHGNFMMEDVMPNEMPTKKLRWLCYVYPSSWAWLRDMRRYNKTKKVYDCDPYCEVYQFRDNLYGLFSENIDGMGDMWEFLIIGPEKAMLIDTGYGLGDYKALCNEITGGKELIVVNTHGHYDHGYGNCRFDKVYCHETAVPHLKTQNAHMWDYIFDENGDHIWMEYDRTQLPVFKEYEIVGVPDGYTFDLGDGYKIELIHTGGHADHHAVFLDKQLRALFCGDMLCSSMTGCGGLEPKPGAFFPEYSTMRYFRDRLEYIISRDNEFDFVFPAHYIIDVDKEVLKDQLFAVNKILADPDDYDFIGENETRDGSLRTVRFKNITNFGVITY